MALDADGPAPYAPTKALVAVLERHRERGLPTPITSDVLVRAGLTSDSLSQRTVQAMRLLGWITDDGQLTERFEYLQRVPEEQYRERLAELVRQGYAAVLEFVDPTRDDLQQVGDAFRAYTPPGMRDRMVTLFLGLCEYTGIIDESPKRSRRASRASSRPGNDGQPRSSQRATQTRGATRSPGVPGDTAGAVQHGTAANLGDLSPALRGFFEALPRGGTMTAQQRDEYAAAFRALLTICYEEMPIKQDE